MVNLEKIVHELPQLVISLKLNLGNSHEIMQQVILINNIQDELRNLQKMIIQELRFATIKNYSIHTLPRLGTIASLFLPHIRVLETDINARSKYITAKFGNPYTEISINDLKTKIDYWIEWGDLLHVISADILSDPQLVNQLNSDSNYSNLPAQVQKISDNLKINLAFSSPQFLQQQLQQLRNDQEEALQVKEKLNYIFNNIRDSPNLLKILLGVSCFCGKSGLSLEWWDDDQELIISSDGKFQELTDILNESEKLQETVDSLIFKIQTLTKQAEQSVQNFEPETQPKPITKRQVKFRQEFILKKPFQPIFLIVSSLVVVIFSGWLIRNKIPYFQQSILSYNQEETAVNNFKSALKLGLEASSLVKNPPHPLIVWEEAEIKWEQAIELLASIPEGTSVYTPATDRLVRYRLNRIAINQRAVNERKAQENLQIAQKLATEANFFQKNSLQSVSSLNQAKDKLQEAINLLENIPRSVSIYPQAQEILPNYKANYASINIIIEN
ncbi:hypothetical protein [Nodularia sp. NIES-3585]|uniref:hypothetical protein n=1 Tax=Nodularia sp. NIES-3585 TaxID=1973477 RepID=UPI000B5D0627|nr:hypothetical protein [Nodularia sp. NIES-3585]GAX38761.1 hypothetical protein NIES3585_48130 [Nodularia sp. NIES-3585]